MAKEQQPGLPTTPSDTSLTFGIDVSTGMNAYDFAARGVNIAAQREKRGIPESLPLPHGPWTMELMPTDLCNVGCSWCSHRTLRSEHVESVKVLRKSGDTTMQPYLARNTLMELLDALEVGGDTKGTYWAGGGEPLTAPYIVEAIERASQFSDVFLQTNAVLLNKFTKNTELLGTLRLISISAVGFDETSTESVHQNNTFHKIDTNVRTVMEMRNGFREENGPVALGRLKVNAKIMVDKTNYLQLPDLVHYWRDDLKIDIIAIRLVQDIYYGETTPTEDQAELSSDQKAELFNLIVANYPQDADLQKFANFLQLRQLTNKITRSCYSTTQGHFGVIDAKGDVYLGNPEIGNIEYSVGNINQQPWAEIWGSKRHKEIAERMNAEQLAGTCNKAFCRHTTANLGVEEYLDGKRKAPDEQEIMDEGYGAFM